MITVNGTARKRSDWRRWAPAVAGLMLLALAPAPLAAQDKAPAGETGNAAKTIATVDSMTITEGDLAVAERGLADTLAEYPPEQKRAFLIDFLVNQKLLAAAARAEKLDEGEEFAKRIALMREWILRDIYLDRHVHQTIDEADVKKSYEEIAAKIRAETELHARHILVKTEEEAKAVAAALKEGADFAETAQEKSIGPSAKQGGDLGYFGQSDVVPPFWEAAAALEPGQLSAPVQSEFGWHIIKLEDKRAKQPPEFDAVKDRIGQNLQRSRYFEVLEKLKADARIEILAGDSEEK